MTGSECNKTREYNTLISSYIQVELKENSNVSEYSPKCQS